MSFFLGSKVPLETGLLAHLIGFASVICKNANTNLALPYSRCFRENTSQGSNLLWRNRGYRSFGGNRCEDAAGSRSRIGCRSWARGGCSRFGSSCLRRARSRRSFGTGSDHEHGANQRKTQGRPSRHEIISPSLTCRPGPARFG